MGVKPSRGEAYGDLFERTAAEPRTPFVLPIPPKAVIRSRLVAFIVYTKSFNHDLRGLLQQGQKKVVQAARAAVTEAGTEGAIRSIPRTKHGETRIPDVEKYELSDGFRLVVQLVDGVAKTRAFLFVGSHDDSDRWLDAHRNYRWVKSRTDGTLEFLQVTERIEERHVPADRMDLESPEDLLSQPLLRVLPQEEWDRLALATEATQFARSISGHDWERDAEGVSARLAQLADDRTASLLWDLLYHSHYKEWSELHQRLAVDRGQATVVPVNEVAPAMLSPSSSESFITFDDSEMLSEFFSANSLADWMLFLHPEQKKVADKELRGPARLRGVSGSGKTSVLIHRARHLAKKYKQPVLLVTLTESMRKLLDQLADDLCGVERELIVSMTMSAVAKQVVHEMHSRRLTFFTVLRPDPQNQLLGDIARQVQLHADFTRTPMKAMAFDELIKFLREEVSYVRSRLRLSDVESYVDTRAFKRHGRGVALNEVSRRVVLAAMRLYDEELEKRHVLDHEGIVRVAVELLTQNGVWYNKYRAVLCDEVQDLSQLEVALLGKLTTPEGQSMAVAENGLFLVGDGAQTIYKRGFTLRSLGIDITGRSFSLKKNYRNTHEILKAAFGLVSQYEFADVDEDDIVKPSEPEFAKRHGPRPMILRCNSPEQEAAAVAGSIRALLTMGQTAGQICIVGPTEFLRGKVRSALSVLGIAHTDLREDVDYESDRVKVSTIESAKGHEFGQVFIMGLVDGVLPASDAAPEEISREAARLYVAMTRARESLTISYSARPGYPASRFLIAIQDNCDEAKFFDGHVTPLTR